MFLKLYAFRERIVLSISVDSPNEKSTNIIYLVLSDYQRHNHYQELMLNMMKNINKFLYFSKIFKQKSLYIQ